MAIGESTTPLQAARLRYNEIATKLFSERSSFDTHWGELAEFYLPRRSRFFITDRNRGDKRNQSIIDSVPSFAARTLQSGMHSGLTSPARPWMKLATTSPSNQDSPEVKQWLADVTERMLSVFLQSNLYNALPLTYGDLGVFGTAALGVMEDDEDLFRCYVYPIGSWAAAVDARGLPSDFVREYEMTVGQVVKKFGYPDGRTTPDWSILSEHVKQAWENQRTQDPVSVCWMVSANPEENQKGKTPWPFLSIHFEKSQGTSVNSLDDSKLLRQSGFWEFPIMLPRWSVTGEDTYGTDCPGMLALGDAKALQVMQKKKAQAIEKQINPPMVGPPSLRTQKVSLLPGDMTFMTGSDSANLLRPVHEVTASVAELSADIQQTEFRIQRAFFEDLFLMLQRGGVPGVQPRTAREIDERHEEKLLTLGPVLERTIDELNDPLIDRVFAMMSRAGMIPDAPEELEGVDLKVEYVSALAQAQKFSGVANTDRFVASVAALVEVMPSVLDKVDPMALVDIYADQIGVNPELVRPTEEAQQIAQQRAQAQQEAAQSEQMQAAANSAKALSQSDLSGDNALTAVADRLSGQAPG